MNLSNSVRVIPVRLFVAALSFLCIPALAQNVVAKPAPSPAPAVAPAPEPTATPAPAAVVVAAPADATTVTATPTPAPAASADPMTKMQTSMTDNVAKNDAADAAMKSHLDSQQAGMKSDMEMKHAVIAQLQAMSDQIKELNERVTALSARLDTPAVPVKVAKPRPAKRPPIILTDPPVAH
jgi:hypothetical protein